MRHPVRMVVAVDGRIGRGAEWCLPGSLHFATRRANTARKEKPGRSGRDDKARKAKPKTHTQDRRAGHPADLKIGHYTDKPESTVRSDCATSAKSAWLSGGVDGGLGALGDGGFDVITVGAGDYFQFDFLWTGGFALADVGAISKAFDVHLLDHG